MLFSQLKVAKCLRFKGVQQISSISMIFLVLLMHSITQEMPLILQQLVQIKKFISTMRPIEQTRYNLSSKLNLFQLSGVPDSAMIVIILQLVMMMGLFSIFIGFVMAALLEPIGTKISVLYVLKRLLDVLSVRIVPNVLDVMEAII